MFLPSRNTHPPIDHIFSSELIILLPTFFQGLIVEVICHAAQHSVGYGLNLNVSQACPQNNNHDFLDSTPSQKSSPHRKVSTLQPNTADYNHIQQTKTIYSRLGRRHKGSSKHSKDLTKCLQQPKPCSSIHLAFTPVFQLCNVTVRSYKYNQSNKNLHNLPNINYFAEFASSKTLPDNSNI